MQALSRLKQKLIRVHREDAGIEALQVVMILAIAAVCLVLIKTKWDDIKKFFTGNTSQAVGDDNWSTK